MQIEWWHWWIAAAVLAALETFMPGAVAIWFAVAAAVVGALVLVLPVPWQLQLVLFGALGLGAIFAYRAYARRNPATSAQPNLNQRGAQYVGRELTLVEPIQQGFGKVRVGDTVWKVTGPPLGIGAKVRVTGVDGAVLIVEAAP
ncbi:MAG TPA: NfeD family protein [Steroidobacteraceae bacterium]|nr:NfeD family protein [Steroidobacteraceae bacterium]